MSQTAMNIERIAAALNIHFSMVVESTTEVKKAGAHERRKTREEVTDQLIKETIDSSKALFALIFEESSSINFCI